MALGFKFVVKSAQLKSALTALQGAMLKGVGDEFDKFTLEVLRDSKTVEPRVPVDTGALMSTGRTEPSARNGSTIQAAVLYGGIAGPPWNAAVDYAVLTHEDLGRQFHRPLAGPKYVETHWEKKQWKVVKGINTLFKKTFRGGVGVTGVI